MPFGLRNGPQTMIRLMDKVLEDINFPSKAFIHDNRTIVCLFLSVLTKNPNCREQTHFLFL
ncbi:hypothetical protein FF38_03570 [Lucilia cuprina]|uniref:Reverse transcriptase domain-containing protein n=1 Tax=Lucilia cuprina TaxID=7375 RepID=A0A0L0CAG0_LUCCU|nr:hypothetical protein FF38_03570 [Lucilia cuprina]